MLDADPGQEAHGWAKVHAEGDTNKTTGGKDADAAHIYTVTNRAELVSALYPDAIIADDGSFTSANGPDNTAKIIYVQGTISLNTNLAGTELTAADYACEGWDFEQYKTDYNPAIWNKTLVDDEVREIPPCPGSQEALRDCSRRNQRAVVQIKVGSNTSLVGVGTDAKIIHGHIIIGGAVPSGAPPQMGEPPLDPDVAEACGLPPPEPVEDAPGPADPLIATAENVIVRNITFEDAYDFFPAWDPTDSFSDPPEMADPESEYPLCQLAVDDATGAGPHQCPGGRWNASYDNITVQNARHVWIDHCTFNDGDRDNSANPEQIWEAPYNQYAMRFQPHDGALDINGTSDFVTVSRNVFRNHDKVMLIGSSDTVRETNGWGYLSVTVHHNQFIDCGQRLPRVRFGKVHVYNNYIQGTNPPVIDTAEDRANKPYPAHPLGSAITVGHLAKVYSENNVFNITGYEGDPDPTPADVISAAHRAPPETGDTPDVGESTYFFDAGSTFNGAAANLVMSLTEQVMASERPEVLGTDTVWKPADTYKYTVTAANGVRANLAKSGAGKISIIKK